MYSVAFQCTRTAGTNTLVHAPFTYNWILFYSGLTDGTIFVGLHRIARHLFISIAAIVVREIIIILILLAMKEAEWYRIIRKALLLRQISLKRWLKWKVLAAALVYFRFWFFFFS